MPRNGANLYIRAAHGRQAYWQIIVRNKFAWRGSGADLFHVISAGETNNIGKVAAEKFHQRGARGQKCPAHLRGEIRQSGSHSLTQSLVCSGYNGQPSIYIVFYDVYKDNQYEYAMAAIMTRRQDRMWNNCRRALARHCCARSLAAGSANCAIMEWCEYDWFCTVCWVIGENE